MPNKRKTTVDLSAKLDWTDAQNVFHYLRCRIQVEVYFFSSTVQKNQKQAHLAPDIDTPQMLTKLDFFHHGIGNGLINTANLPGVHTLYETRKFEVLAPELQQSRWRDFCGHFEKICAKVNVS